jgi:hypothetical protein
MVFNLNDIFICVVQGKRTTRRAAVPVQIETDPTAIVPGESFQSTAECIAAHNYRGIHANDFKASVFGLAFGQHDFAPAFGLRLFQFR